MTSEIFSGLKFTHESHRCDSLKLSHCGGHLTICDIGVDQIGENKNLAADQRSPYSEVK